MLGKYGLLGLPGASRIRERALASLIALVFAVTVNAEEPTSESVDTVLNRAELFYSKKKYEDARREYERAIALDKGSLSAWRGLAWSLWALGKKDRAYEIWSNLANAFPDDTSILMALAKASERDGYWSRALDSYSRILSIIPDDKQARRGRARIFLAQRDYKPAEQEARAVLRHASSDVEANTLLADALIGQQRYKDVESILRRLTEADPVPENLRRLAHVLGELGRYQDAVSYYRKCLRVRRDEGLLAAWRNLGSKLRQRGRNQEAYEIWQDLLRDFPDDVPTLLAIGRASEQDQLWGRALDHYALVLRKAPDDEAARLGRARVFSAQKDYRAAEREIRALLDRFPGSVKARLALADNLAVTGNLSEAEAVLRSLVAANPTPENLRRLGTILADLGKNEEAIDHLKRSLQQQPDDYLTTLGLAHAYWNEHRYDEAVDVLKRFLAAHPDKDIARARLAEHYTALADWDQAEREWSILVQKHPEDSLWKMRLAQLLHWAGRHEDATGLARQVLDREPENVRAIQLLADDAVFAGDIENGIRWLERLMAVAPSPEQLVRLGELHLDLAERLAKEGKPEAAAIHYASALKEFERAAELDPIKSEGPVQIVEGKRLQGRASEAIELAEQLRAKYPNSAHVLQQLADVYSEQGDYAAARDMLEAMEALYPANTALKQNIAKLSFYHGDSGRAFRMLNQLYDGAGSPSIPVLLYHGVTVSDRQDTMPLKKFREQMYALKKEGYQSITMRQLLDFLEGKNVDLPPKPILITFDDARADSFRNADPVLAETGFKATMFVPVADVATRGAYTVVWSEIRRYFATGRWDMQCHSTEGQHYVPVDKEGHMGRFLVNRLWLEEQGRQETSEEYAARIDADYRNCLEVLRREVPGAEIIAFAYPFSDQGHKSLSNEPAAFKLNHETVQKYFRMAFHVENDHLVTRNSPRYYLPRFEVPREYTGSDLVRQLKAVDPMISTSTTLAMLYTSAGHHSKALAILDKLEQEGAMEDAEFLVATGKVLRASGDYAGARDRFQKAMALSPNDPQITHELAELDRRLRPVMEIEGFYFDDNENRSFFSIGPSVSYGISDKLSFWGYYKYIDFDQKVDLRPAGASGPMKTHFQTAGHQFEGQLRYDLSDLNPRSAVTVSAGVADFSSQSSPAGAPESSPTFPLGSIRFNAGVGDDLDFSVGVDHGYVDTAGAIADHLTFFRALGGFKLRAWDTLSLSASHMFFSYYDDNNERNRTEVLIQNRFWNEPEISIGAQFVFDDTRKMNPLFWTPDNYIGLMVPVTLRAAFGKGLSTEVTVAPGAGKETDTDFRFQISAGGTVKWKVADNFSLYVSASRYEAATYSNFTAGAGVLVEF
ncbi:tetratricopeptide repeat protein [Methylocaldum szegediense]|uniref:tetratricopeptide repeat protein n=1 Tax=Methylocaldum szegediense TaxID=73780 RepID=UPI00041EC10B|nr:tetratricopeptide repeat protein [Methylocaldum szegediense]